MSVVFDLSEFENRTAVVNEHGEHLSYKDVIKLCSAMSSFFDLKEKKLVMILAKNNIETIIGYLAALQSNNTAMLIDANLDREFLSNLKKLYNPDYIWGPANDEDKAAFCYKDYKLVQFGWADNTKLHPALSVLLSTSGSTGSPKVVRLTKDNIKANARSIAAYLNLNETEKPITNLPLHYSYGLSIINSHLTVGATILVTDTPIVKKEFWEFFKRESGTSLAGVPYTYELYKNIGLSKMKLPTLRYMTQAGGKLDPQLVLEYANLSREKNFKFYVMYGATEATARISYLSPEYNSKKAGSIGKAIPQGKLQLISESGKIITRPYIEGELVYEGPNVMMGYAHCRQDLAQGDELLGSLETGDLAYFDEDGFYYITGRKSRFIKILGNRISLYEIEGYLHTKGLNCFCGGKDDQLLIACYQEKGEAKQKELLSKIRTEVLLKYKIPLALIKVYPIKNVPRNSSGKVNYQEIFSQIVDKEQIS